MVDIICHILKLRLPFLLNLIIIELMNHCPSCLPPWLAMSLPA